MASWPASLPFLSAVGNATQSGPDGHLLRTQMGVGPDKIRRRSSYAPRRFSATSPAWTPAQLATFEAFYDGDLGGGALSFTAQDPFTCTTKTYRFVGPYEVRHGGTVRYLSAVLEILP